MTALRTPTAGPRRATAPLAVLAAVTVTVAALGIPTGYVWAAVAPRVVLVATGHGAAQVMNPETKAFIAADGWFCVLGIAAGVLAAAAGYLAAVRRHGPTATLGLILGGLAASLLAWWIGRGIGHTAFRDALYLSTPGQVLHAPPTLRARGALVVWPLTSALVVAFAELLAGQRHDTTPVTPPAVPPGAPQM